MRVLHVIPAVASRYGGPSAAIAPMCRALSALGAEPTIITTDADGTGSLEVPHGVLTRWHDVPTIFFTRDFSESFKYSAGLARWLRRHVHEFDLVHIHAVLSHACLAAARAGFRAGVPYIVRPLGTLAPWSLDQKAIKKRLLLALGARTMIERAAAVHCTSVEEQNGISQTFPGVSPVVVPLGIEASVLAETPILFSTREAHPYVLVLSRLHPKKNLEVLMEAFARATADPTFRTWQLVIAGTGDADYVAALGQFAERQGLADRVQFAGWVAGERKRALIAEASLFALVSLHENFGMSLLEAMAAGVPGLVSRQVDLADAVAAANAGWIVDGDMRSVLAGLTAALPDAGDRAARGRAARQLAEQFTWPAIAPKIVEMYQGCLATPPLANIATSPNRPVTQLPHH